MTTRTIDLETPTPTEHGHCRACGGANFHTIFEAPCHRTLPASSAHRYGECADCASLTLLDEVDPSPFYDAGYERHGASAAPATPTSTTRVIGAFGDRVVRPLPLPASWWFPGHPTWLAWFRGSSVSRSSPILDVGCGNGALLAHLSRFGFENLRGIDPYLRESSLELGSIELRRRALVDEPGRYDAIIFNHSLEHVDDPVDQLTAARDRVAVGGRVIVDLPIAGGLAWRRFRESWAGLDPPLHRFVPSPAGMERLAEQAGLRLLRWHGSTTPYFYRHSMLIRNGAAPLHSDSTLELGERMARWSSRRAASEHGSDAAQGSFVLTTR